MSEECSDSLDCFYEGSACVDGSCACADGYHQSSNKDSCNKNVDGKTLCSKYKFQIEYEYILSGY